MEHKRLTEHLRKVIKEGAHGSQPESEPDVMIVLALPAVSQEPPLVRAHRHQSESVLQICLSHEGPLRPHLVQCLHRLVDAHVLEGEGLAVDEAVDTEPLRLGEIQDEPDCAVGFDAGA